MTNPTIERCPIFHDFTIDEYEQILGLLEQETYARATVILHEGMSMQALWILVRGACEVVKLKTNGESRQLAALEPGAVFGEMSFFQSAPHSATVRTCSDVAVMRLTRANYEHLRTSCPSAAYKIALSVVSVMAQRLRQMDQWTCQFVERPEAAGHREEWHDFRAKLYSDWQF